MKKTICLLLTALLLCALLGSCGKKTISEVDLTLTVGGTAVRPDTSVSALLDAFGTDYTYSEAVSCVYTGMDKTYAYSDRILYTYPDGDADRLLELPMVFRDSGKVIMPSAVHFEKALSPIDLSSVPKFTV